MREAANLADEPDDWLARRWAESENFTATAEGTSRLPRLNQNLELAAVVPAMLTLTGWVIMAGDAGPECRA